MCHRMVGSKLVSPDKIRRAFNLSSYSNSSIGSADVQYIRAKFLGVIHVKGCVGGGKGASIKLLASFFGVKVCSIKQDTHGAIRISGRSLKFLAGPHCKHFSLDGLARAHRYPRVLRGIVGGRCGDCFRDKIRLFGLENYLVAAAAALLAAAFFLFIHQLLESIKIDGPTALLGHDLSEIKGETARVVEQKCKFFRNNSSDAERRGFAVELFDALLEGTQKSEFLIEDNALRQ